MDCPICHKTTRQLYFIKRFDPPLDIHQCPNCGLQMQANIDPDLSKLYQKEYFTGEADYSYKDERETEQSEQYVWKARLKNIARFIPPPAEFLDIGCAFGGFVGAAKDFGYHAQGLDLSPYAVQYARSKDLEIHQGALSPSTFPEQSFDVVSLVEVMEHLSDPQKVLESLQKIVRPNGLVLVQTANFLGWQARLAKAHYHYYLPGHLFYYSTKNLQQLFGRYGFDRFRFFRGVDFHLKAKLQKVRGNFPSLWDYYLACLKVIRYHLLSRIAYRDFSLTSSMVMYAFRNTSK